MAIRRYARTPVLNLGFQYGTTQLLNVIRKNIANGTISYKQMVMPERERLDTIAGKVYGDGRLWWIIAAASGIGYSLQVPEGTVLIIPELSEISKFAG